MGLEAAWQVFSWVVLFVTAPLWATSMLDSNPFTKGSGWVWQYTKALKDKNSHRNSPFGVPVVVSTVVWAVVAAAAAIPCYTIYHNGGLNDGWQNNPIPLAFGVIALILTNWWLPVYLTDCRCYNIGWAQVFATGASMIFFLQALADSTQKYYSILSVGLLLWNGFWLVKNLFEENKKCADSLGLVEKCSLISTF
jgi:hypothetical protein